MTISALGTIVSTNWLRNIFSSQTAYKLRVLDVSWARLKPDIGYQQFYLKQHIPGSLYFDLNQCSTPTKLLPFPVPNSKCLSDYIGNLGIDKETHVVTYDQEDNRSAVRAWWLFRYFGHPKVSLLDGGLRKWVASGFDVTSKPTTSEKCKYECVPHPSLSRDYIALQRNLGSKEEQVVDTRPDRFFTEGHIPNSKNIPFSQLFTEDGTFKSEEELKERPTAEKKDCVVPIAHMGRASTSKILAFTPTTVFSTAGIDLKKPLIGTCQLGVTACGIAAAAHILGNTNTSIYMGSWNEWSQRASPDHISEG